MILILGVVLGFNSRDRLMKSIDCKKRRFAIVAPDDPAVRRSVAVLGFKNSSGRTDAGCLSTGCADSFGSG